MLGMLLFFLCCCCLPENVKQQQQQKQQVSVMRVCVYKKMRASVNYLAPASRLDVLGHRCESLNSSRTDGSRSLRRHRSLDFNTHADQRRVQIKKKQAKANGRSKLIATYHPTPLRLFACSLVATSENGLLARSLATTRQSANSLTRHNSATLRKTPVIDLSLLLLLLLLLLLVSLSLSLSLSPSPICSL